MSKTFRGGKKPGYEYWSARPGNESTYASVGSTQKKITHRIERRRDQNDLKKQLKDLDC